MPDKKICMACKRHIVHPARKYKICLDCLIDILIFFKAIPPSQSIGWRDPDPSNKDDSSPKTEEPPAPTEEAPPKTPQAESPLLHLEEPPPAQPKEAPPKKPEPPILRGI